MDKEKGFDELLSIEIVSDADLAEIVSGAIEYMTAEAGGTMPVSAPQEYTTVFVICSLCGYLEGEGVASFLWLDCQHQVFVHALETLGFRQLAAGFQELLSLTDPKHLGCLDAVIQDVGEERLERSAMRLQKDFFSMTDQVRTAVAEYIREKRDVFRPLLPAMRVQFGYLSRFDPEWLNEFYNSIDWDEMKRQVADELRSQTEE